MTKKYFSGNNAISPAQQRIHKMLGEVLDGINHVRVGVVTPYYYTVGEFSTVFRAKSFLISCNETLDACDSQTKHQRSVFLDFFQISNAY